MACGPPVTDPIRQAIEAGDLCEVGRLYAKQLAEMDKPVDPRSGLQREAGAHLNAGSEPAHSTPPRPAPSAATQPSQGGGVGISSEELK